MTKVFIKFGSKLYPTMLTILPYKGCTMMWQGKTYKIADVIIYADLNTVHILL